MQQQQQQVQVQPARTRQQRKADTLELLADPKPPHIVLATVNKDGETAHQTPLTFYWDGHRFTMGLVEPESKLTADNLRRTGKAHGFVGSTLNVVMVQGPVTFIPVDDIDPAIADGVRGRWTAPVDFSKVPGFVFVQLHPQRIRAYRPGYAERDEHDRIIMRDGRWLV